MFAPMHAAIRWGLRNRASAGPAATALFVLAVFLFDQFVAPVPIPGTLIVIVVLGAAYHGGISSAVLSSIIAIAFISIHMSRPGMWFSYVPEIQARAWIFLLMVPGVALIIGLLREHAFMQDALERQSRERVEHENRELESLRTAIDQINLGVMLLDGEMRVRFMSRAMLRFGNLPENVTDGVPHLRELLKLACDTGVFPVPRHKRQQYIEARIAQVQAGDPMPRELRLGNGDIARMQCAVLPDGGRLLTYTLVTDLVRQAEELLNLRVALDQADYGIVLLNREMRVEFMNREVRRRGMLGDPVAGQKPLFADVLRRVAENGIYADRDDDIDQHVAERLAWTRGEDAAPYEFVRADGRITRVKNIAMRDGARMLIYTDETDAVRHVDELEELASIDGLTGLYNRRHFLGLADTAWAAYLTSGSPLSLLMIDIDHFKAVNDRFGHDAGDRVLARMAEVLREEKRGADIAARLGGEELVLLLPDTPLNEAYIVAERLRIAVASGRGKDDIPAVTISAGAATATGDMRNLEMLIKSADRALYAAKHAGRNRVMIAADARIKPTATAA